MQRQKQLWSSSNFSDHYWAVTRLISSLSSVVSLAVHESLLINKKFKDSYNRVEETV